MQATTHFELGQIVRLARACPIESEGVGPRPGDRGRIVRAPRHNDHLPYWGVDFDTFGGPWPIPERLLERADTDF